MDVSARRDDVGGRGLHDPGALQCQPEVDGGAVDGPPFPGRQDRHLRSRFDRVAGIGRDQVVGLEIRQLDLADVECFGRAPYMCQLWK